jgi:hypothetical protein
VAEHLPSKYKALSSNPSTAKNKGMEKVREGSTSVFENNYLWPLSCLGGEDTAPPWKTIWPCLGKRRRGTRSLSSYSPHLLGLGPCVCTETARLPQS